MQDYLKLIDNTLKPHLQKDVIMTLNNKVVRTGKFILYNFQDFYIELDIIFNNKIKKTMIPIPFEVEHYEQENLLYLDYRIKTLYNKLPVTDADNKFYNKILEIQFK